MHPDIHSFYIPVMGTAFTIESPVKVAKYGISSVISSVDDLLIEKMRKFHCKLAGREYIPIDKYDHDARARRITAYLNLLNGVVKDQFAKLKASAFQAGTEITKYFELLSDSSALKQRYKTMLSITDPAAKKQAQTELRSAIRPGSIDLNIMTKLDRMNFDKSGTPLPAEYSDALAALRGFANSDLTAAIVFSAGFNGRLYSYVEQFKDFHADESGFLKKKIVIKVSDFRSAHTQGKFFAKKGLWVSEYRVESGLNCGGHAFGQGGSLMGPNLEEFKLKKQELIAELFEIYNKALAGKGKPTFSDPHPLRITAQGGVGTAQEHNFILDYYGIDAVGWGTAFLLVPEATTVDPQTLERLCRADQDDLYLSDVSPLGVPFSNLRTSSSEQTKMERIRSNRHGSPCFKGLLATNTEFTDTPICVASRAYQKKKLQQLESQALDPEAYQKAYEKIVNKSCICNDLGGAAILAHDLVEPNEAGATPAICPGPNLAYFSRIVSLQEMVDHIYGRNSITNDTPRPNMFISELKLNIDYLESEINELKTMLSEQSTKYLKAFRSKLLDGVSYYQNLLDRMHDVTSEYRLRMLAELQVQHAKLQAMVQKYEGVFA
ncbi:hypothetical protein [Desulfoferrobacter suflitae]|uniref:hypothetical protein n=1 Tax=Desulfoferrobacter suflitae TaxID=2865782 RepID=UPI002164DD2B|nr:hypothetical protein [Desulfoferrobacter suflitae]MCK8603040.1 hypothetical protein [Desulfoferrobacter suflitae]